MKVIYTILVAVILLLVGNWYYAEHMPAAEENVSTEIPNNEDPDLISAVDPKSGIAFEYPKELKTNYISTTEWPPRFVNSVDTIKCELDEQTQAMSGATSSIQTINGNIYCVWETNEGAAGSVYRTYQLTYTKENQYFTMSFTLQYPQCINYPLDEAKECELEQDEFPLNNLIDSIAQSARLPV